MDVKRKERILETILHDAATADGQRGCRVFVRDA
jgi:hypothetical protein